MSKRLYKVKFVNQMNGEDVEHYVLAQSLAVLEDEYSDLLLIELLSVIELE